MKERMEAYLFCKKFFKRDGGLKKRKLVQMWKKRKESELQSV